MLPLAEAPDQTLLCCASDTLLVFSDLRGKKAGGKATLFQVQLPQHSGPAEAACFNAEKPELFLKTRDSNMVFDLVTRAFRPAAPAEFKAISPKAWLPPVRPRPEERRASRDIGSGVQVAPASGSEGSGPLPLLAGHFFHEGTGSLRTGTGSPRLSPGPPLAPAPVSSSGGAVTETPTAGGARNRSPRALPIVTVAD